MGPYAVPDVRAVPTVRRSGAPFAVRQMRDDDMRVVAPRGGDSHVADVRCRHEPRRSAVRA
jgi:hypothetical protein